MSEQVRHTPGPWAYRTGKLPRIVSFKRNYWEVGQPNGFGVCIVFGNDPANARLTAAAPTMLAALKTQHNAIDILLAMLIERDRKFTPSKSQVWPMLLEGLAAIDEAEGRAP